MLVEGLVELIGKGQCKSFKPHRSNHVYVCEDESEPLLITVESPILDEDDESEPLLIKVESPRCGRE